MNLTGSTLQLVNGICLLVTFFYVRIIYGGMMASLAVPLFRSLSEQMNSLIDSLLHCGMCLKTCRPFTCLYIPRGT